MRIPFIALSILVALGCSRSRRAEAPCAQGSPGFTAYPATCTNERCRACAAELSALWAQRGQRSARARFRQRFMRAPADARDEFARTQHPDGTYPLEHCTAGLAPGSSCVTYSPYCVGVLSAALRDGDTPMRWRVQLDVAMAKSCDRSRDEVLASVGRCEPFTDTASCDSPACGACLAGHVATLTVLAPVIDRANRLEQFVRMIDATPEVVARATVIGLGAPEPPADVEPQVVQAAVRHHCMSLLRRSATAPPMQCDSTMAHLLSHPAYSDFERAWASVSTARPEVRRTSLDALLAALARGGAVPPPVLAKLRDLPPGERAEVLRRALGRPVDPAVYPSLRAELITAAPGEPPPPEVQAPAAAPTEPSAPAAEPPTGGTRQAPPSAPARPT